MTPEQHFAQIVATDASHPFVTYYAEASGERSELSAKSLANWVAKTHFLLGDELGRSAVRWSSSATHRTRISSRVG